MRIQILGTAAAEGWPALFCGCDTCQRARAAGGPNIRSRSSVLIDGRWKIDLPPDTWHHVATQEIDLSRLGHLFITHTHSDHCDLNTLEFVHPPFALRGETLLQVYGAPALQEAVHRRFGQTPPGVQLHALEPGQSVNASGLRFTAVRAQHDPAELCLNYVIQSDTATVLYASDTGAYEPDVLDVLSGWRFDWIIAECTMGTLAHDGRYHMTFHDVLRLRERLTQGATSASVRTVITHFSHNIGLLHDELEQTAAPEGIVVAYDGIVLDTA